MDATVAELVDIEAIKRLKARYFRQMDLKLWDRWRQVFTEDVVIEADGFTFEGRDSFVTTLSTMLADVRTTHHGFMPEITITGPDTATGIWAMRDHLVFPGDGPPIGFVGYGHYHESYLRDGGSWQIRRLTLTRLGIDPLEGGLPATLAG